MVPRRTAVAMVAAIVVSLGAVLNGRSVRQWGRNPQAAGDDLSVEQARLADRFERLETVLARLAELSASTDPRRARLLREAIAKSREQDARTAVRDDRLAARRRATLGRRRSSDRTAERTRRAAHAAA